MKIEHMAIQVEDPISVERWYVDHLGMTVARSTKTSPFMHFLADDGGHVMIEIYNNPDVPVPDYQSLDPFLLHLAFASDDVLGDHKRLIDAGASSAGEIFSLETGDTLSMMRDPWGFPIQLCHRAEPMI